MTLVRARSVKEVAEFVQARVLGDETVQLNGIASVESALPGDLVFVDDQKNLRLALESKGSAVITGKVAKSKTPKPLLIATQPRLAFARAAHCPPGCRLAVRAAPSSACSPAACSRCSSRA